MRKKLKQNYEITFNWPQTILNGQLETLKTKESTEMTPLTKILQIITISSIQI